MSNPTAFFADRSDRGRLRLTGRDRQSFLQGMVTNDVAALTPGTGCYALMLDATGHVLADMRVLCAESHLLLDLEPGMAPFVAETLDRYLIMEKCRIADVTGETAQVFLGTRHSLESLETPGLSGCESWSEGQHQVAPFAGVLATVAATRLVPGGGFDIHIDAADKEELLRELRGAGVTEIAPDALETLRIEAGIPRFGADMDARVLAPETGQQARAISFRKGCYIGQEIVARIDARGHANRGFTGFLFESGGDVPAPGTPVTADDKEIGRITSSALSLTLNRPIALGYIRREHAAPGTPVTVAERPAVVAALPLVSEGED